MPTPESNTLERITFPELRVDGLAIRLVTVPPSVSVNVLTVPVGTVDLWPDCVSAIVAVMVVARWPTTSEVGTTATVVEVVSPGCRPVPVTATFCVLLATFKVLSVTLMDSLNNPTDCGVNFVEISQTVPAVSDVEEVHGFVSPEFAM